MSQTGPGLRTEITTRSFCKNGLILCAWRKVYAHLVWKRPPRGRELSPTRPCRRLEVGSTLLSSFRLWRGRRLIVWAQSYQALFQLENLALNWNYSVRRFHTL